MEPHNLRPGHFSTYARLAAESTKQWRACDGAKWHFENADVSAYSVIYMCALYRVSFTDGTFKSRVCPPHQKKQKTITGQFSKSN